MDQDGQTLGDAALRGVESFHKKLAPCIGEFIGTFMLVFTVGCCLMAAPHSAWNGVAIASVLMVAIYSMAPVSGGHLNPSVSLAIWLSTPNFSFKKMISYIVAQLLGGLIAGFCFTTMFNRSASLSVGLTYGYWEVGVVEITFTMMLAFVVLNVACTQRVNQPGNSNQFYGLAIAFVIVAGAYAGGPISGAVFNPAVALGIEASSFHGSFSAFAYYVIFQVLGSLIACVLFRVVRPDEFGPTNEYSLSTKMASQFIGTWLITLTAGVAVLTATVAGSVPVWPLAVGACYMCMTYALGDISNGFFNPAATFAFLCCGRKYMGRKYMAIDEGFALIFIQIVASMCAAFVYAGLGQGSHEHTYHTFPIRPAVIPRGEGQNYVGEMAFTGLIAFAALGVTSIKARHSVVTLIPELGEQSQTLWQAGLAIGLSSVVGGVALDLLGQNGGMLNPAITLGAATVSSLTNDACWSCSLKYVLYEFLGGLSAAVLFRVTYAEVADFKGSSASDQ
jgi:aquaporin Z